MEFTPKKKMAQMDTGLKMMNIPVSTKKNKMTNN